MAPFLYRDYTGFVCLPLCTWTLRSLPGVFILACSELVRRGQTSGEWEDQSSKRHLGNPGWLFPQAQLVPFFSSKINKSLGYI